MLKTFGDVKGSEYEHGMGERLEHPLWELAPFKLENPVLQEYMMWLYQNGADTARLARIMVLTKDYIWVQDRLVEHIREEGYKGITTLEEVEKIVDKVVMYVSGTAQSSIGLEDIAMLGTTGIGRGVAQKGARFARWRAVYKTKMYSRAIAKVEALGLKPEAELWAKKLVANCQKHGIEIRAAQITQRAKYYEHYKGIMQKLPRTSIRGNKGFRGIPLHSTHPLRQAHPRGMARFDNRWNLPEEKAVYFAKLRKGAEGELEKWYGEAWRDEKIIKRDWLSSNNVLDLTDPKNLKALGITNKFKLLGKNKELPQVLGSIANELGVEVLIVPAKEAGKVTKNIVLLGQ